METHTPPGTIASSPDTVTDAGPGALGVLRSCSGNERRTVKAAAEHRHVDRGAVICEAGGFGDELYVLVAGSVAVCTPGAEHGDGAVVRLGPGAAFGEMAPLARTPRRQTVVALTPTSLVVFRRSEFARLLERAPRVGRALLRAASTRLRTRAPAPTLSTV